MRDKASNILIVDDSALITERLIDMLKDIDSDGSIFTAANVAEAMILMDQQHFTTVLLDINLQGASGIELLKLIVQNYSHCKVIMVSNNATRYYRSLCEALGAKHFVDKSKDFELIPSLVAPQQVWC